MNPLPPVIRISEGDDMFVVDGVNVGRQDHE